MAIVDLMSNDRWTGATLRARCQALIAERYSLETEANLNRKINGVGMNLYTLTVEEQAEVNAYAAFLEEIKTAGLQAESDAVLLHQTLDFEAAKDRLARYRLADGKPAEVIYGEPDPLTGEQAIVGEVPAIEPLPALVDEVGQDGTITQVPNPLIVADDAERAAAQGIVDAATTAVLDLAGRRA